MYYSEISPYLAVIFTRTQGATKRCRLSLLTNSTLVLRVQMRGRGGVAGSQPMSTAVHITGHGAQINFGDLPPYLTYARTCSEEICHAGALLFGFGGELPVPGLDPVFLHGHGSLHLYRTWQAQIGWRDDRLPSRECWARIFKHLWSPGIDSKEWFPPPYVAWRAGTITLFLIGSSPP